MTRIAGWLVVVPLVILGFIICCAILAGIGAVIYILGSAALAVF